MMECVAECPHLQYTSAPGPGDSSRAVVAPQSELVYIQVLNIPL